MPEPQWHLAAAPVPFLLAARLGRAGRPGVAAASSVLIDVDHFVDVAYYQLTGDRARQIIPFHALELLPILATRRTSLARSVALGLAVHFAMDLLFGGYSVGQLSLLHRVSRRMRTNAMGDWADWPRGSSSWRALVGAS